MVRFLTGVVWVVAGVALAVFVANLLALLGVDLGVIAQQRTRDESIAATVNTFLIFGGAFVLAAILSLLSSLVSEVRALRKSVQQGRNVS